MKREKSLGGVYFLVFVLLIYLVILLVDLESGILSLRFAFGIFRSVFSAFVFVFVLMVLVNYFVNPLVISRYLSKSSGLKKWFIAVVGGIISTGPIYMWYPMLRELHNRGVGYEFVSVFLYNRALKPAILPLMIFYFGVKFVIVLSLVMIFISIVQGLIFEKLEEDGLI
jgi:uncharacterized membrane protein YraQ (UPF0718 family)